jgi:N-carbamoyl-L-amino-acid hydrolase
VTNPRLSVDAERLRADFDRLSSFGATSGGGVNRPTFSQAHLAARAWFLERAREGGLIAGVDAAGNHSARLPAGGSRTLLLGSHLDSVPDGGRYDGALGVLGAFEAVRVVHDARLDLPVTLEAIDFTDEEGTLVGLIGSRALTGALRRDELRAPRGGRAALTEGLARAGLSEENMHQARRDPSTLAGYLELHIEQGPRLERSGHRIGVVTAIVGSRSYELTFKGQAGHAGTTPMDSRHDAGVGAASFILAARETVTSMFPDCVATVGRIAFEPGAFNVIPGSARLALEFRAPESGRLDALESALLERARSEAEAAGLELSAEPVGRWEPTHLDRGVRSAITRAATTLGLEPVEMPSGAGHDAQSLATVTPSGMIFVPSVKGISHSPAEHTSWEDCVAGANVLLAAALDLALASGA